MRTCLGTEQTSRDWPAGTRTGAPKRARTRSGDDDRIRRMTFHIANEAAADQVLDEQPFAVLVGMMLDQHIR
jgi:hypothetical protein